MKKNIIQIVTIISIVTISIFVYHSLFTKKIVYVDLNELYNKFDLKNELEKKIEQTSLTKKNILDSLKLNLEINYKNLQSKGKNAAQNEIEAFNFLKNEYFSKSQNFENGNTQMVEQYDKEIWTQLNKYVSDYGKAHSYDLIVGANGDGSVMYGNDALNITNDVLQFVNNKYKGNNK